MIKRYDKDSIPHYRYGTTPLVWACRGGHASVVNLLLEAGARVETAGMYSWTPLSEAAKEILISTA